MSSKSTGDFYSQACLKTVSLIRPSMYESSHIYQTKGHSKNFMHHHANTAANGLCGRFLCLILNTRSSFSKLSCFAGCFRLRYMGLRSTGAGGELSVNSTNLTVWKDALLKGTKWVMMHHLKFQPLKAWVWNGQPVKHGQDCASGTLLDWAVILMAGPGVGFWWGCRECYLCGIIHGDLFVKSI